MPKFTVGNKKLRSGIADEAMSDYVDTLNRHPELAIVLSGNIRLTQIAFKRQCKKQGLEALRIQSADFVSTIEHLPIWLEESQLAPVIVSDGFCFKRQNKKDCDFLDIGVGAAMCAAENPALKVHVLDTNLANIMLGWMHHIIWQSKVYILVGSEKKVPIERYLESQANIDQLALIACSLKPLNVKLIKYLSWENEPKTILNINWPRCYENIQSLYEILIETTDDQFLDNLYQTLLGRDIEPEVKGYFLSELKENRKCRNEIVQQVAGSEECKRRLSETQNLAPNFYPVPLPGEIRPEDIRIPSFENPLVSVLIPVYGKLEYTLACLKSIADNLPKASFEVLVIDDQSPDKSAQLLKKIPNINVVENSSNLGFLRSCNSGATKANGEFLFFLNNDTQVKPGWLDELLLTFENFPGCGLVGSKLIYPNGKLQEAGCIIWKDGSAWNYGRGDDPNKPEYNYAREVDYCSGAAILIKKEIFEELGCFDERYVPAYCEDSDLALTVRNAGYRVIYQPLSEVVHFEGVSSGTDLNPGVKAYQVTNLKKQFAKWKKVLSTHRANGIQPWLERDRDAKGRILFIDATTPTPDQDSGSIDTFNLMLMFRDLGYHVSFIPEDNFAYIEGYTQELQRHGFNAIYHPYTNTLVNHLKEYGDNYEIIMIFRPGVADRSISKVRQYCPNAKIIFNTVDLHFLRLKREYDLTGNAHTLVESQKIEKVELDLMHQADISTVISAHEYELLKQRDSALRIFHLPYSRGISREVKPFKERDGVIFVGGFQHPPNLDAVKYLTKEIWPLVLKDLPVAKLHIVGSNCPPEINALASVNIVVHGFLKNLEQLLQRVKVNVVPLRYGAGIKGKLGGAMAHGLPSVSSTIGAEGMGLKNSFNGVYFSDKKEKLANQIVILLNNESMWNKYSNSAIEFAELNWGPKALRQNIINLLNILEIDVRPFRSDTKLI